MIGAAGTEIALFQNNAFPFEDHSQRNGYADRLRKRCAKRRARRSQSQSAHKKIVQSDIRGAGHGDEVHRAFAVAQTAENGTDDIVRRDKRDPDQADDEIGGCAVRCFCRGGHHGNDGANQYKQNYHQRDGNRHKQRHGVSDVLRGLLSVSCANGLPDADGGSHGKPYDHDGEHMHDL